MARLRCYELYGDKFLRLGIASQLYLAVTAKANVDVVILESSQEFIRLIVLHNKDYLYHNKSRRLPKDTIAMQNVAILTACS